MPVICHNALFNAVCRIVIYIKNLSAFRAEQMTMRICPRVKAVFGIVDVDLSELTQLGQKIQIPVYRTETQPGVVLFQRGVYFIRGGVDREILHLIEDHLPLP